MTFLMFYYLLYINTCKRTNPTKPMDCIIINRNLETDTWIEIRLTSVRKGVVGWGIVEELSKKRKNSLIGTTVW